MAPGILRMGVARSSRNNFGKLNETAKCLLKLPQEFRQAASGRKEEPSGAAIDNKNCQSICCLIGVSGQAESCPVGEGVWKRRS